MLSKQTANLCPPPRPPQVQQVQEAAAKAAMQLHFTPRSAVRLWSDEEVAAAQQLELEPSPVVDAFGSAMTGLYARYQGRAAVKVGVDPGGPCCCGCARCVQPSACWCQVPGAWLRDMFRCCVCWFSSTC